MGRDKALLPLPGAESVTFVQHLITLLRPACEEVVLVARDATQAEALGQSQSLSEGMCILTDKVAGMGPLMGLYSGLSEIHSSHALVMAVDMPFIQPALLSWLFSQRLDEAILVPVVNQVPQVLLAIYPRALLPIIEERLQKGRRDPRSLLESAPVRYIEEAQLREIDPQLRSFVNLNTPEELATYTD